MLQSSEKKVLLMPRWTQIHMIFHKSHVSSVWVATYLVSSSYTAEVQMFAIQLYVHLIFGLNQWWERKVMSSAAVKPVTKHHCFSTPKYCNSGQLALLAKGAKQNIFFHLITDGINLKITCIKTPGEEKENKQKAHLATFCLQDTHLDLAFILGDGVLDFFAEGGKETTASPSAATVKRFICFCSKAYKSRAFTMSPEWRLTGSDLRNWRDPCLTWALVSIFHISPLAQCSHGNTRVNHFLLRDMKPWTEHAYD